MSHAIDARPSPGDLVTNAVSRLPTVFVAVTAAMADVSILTGWIGGVIGASGAIRTHCLIAVSLCLLGALLQKRANPQLLILGLLLVLLGPLGAFAVLVAGLHIPEQGALNGARNVIGRSRMADAADTTPAEAMAMRVLQGRRPQAAHGPIESYDAVFRKGDVVRQQRALAAISRSYAPEMLGSLNLALASPFPAVRVQAAAVFAKLRGSFTERSTALLAANLRDLGDDDAGSMIAECRLVARSGFVEAMVADRLATRIEELGDIRAAAEHPRIAGGGQGALPSGAPRSPNAADGRSNRRADRAMT